MNSASSTPKVSNEISAELEHPWVKARRLLTELSETLQECDEGRWFAHVVPPAPMAFNGFGSLPMGRQEDNLPIDRINSLAWALSEALNDYQGGQYQAKIYPSKQAGHSVMFAKTKLYEEA